MKLSSLLIISLLLLQHNKGEADELQKALIDRHFQLKGGIPDSQWYPVIL